MAPPQVIVELADVRILALGILAKPRSNLSVNPNARIFVNPPGIPGDTQRKDFFSKVSVRKPLTLIDDHGVYPLSQSTVPDSRRSFVPFPIVPLIHELDASL